MAFKSIEIVGAGPAGLVAAINLRKAGFHVTVYEERQDVGMRFHGDFQGIENWSQKEDVLDQFHQMGVSINFACTPFHDTTLFGPARGKLHIHTEVPLFYLVRRGPGEGSLDQGLKAQAQAIGVEILFGRRVEKVKGLGVTATGPKGADVIAKGVIFETGLPDQAVAILDDRLAPEGYAYLIVHKGRATMATTFFREYHREKEYFELTKQAFSDLGAFKMERPREFGGYGNFFMRPTAEHGHHLYVGESAGFQDFLWGFGIRYAMTSGFLAAQSLIQGRSYDSLWKAQLLPQLQASIINRVFWVRWRQLVFRYGPRWVGRVKDIRGFVRWVYSWRPWKRLVLLYAIRHYQTRVKDERCQHTETCDCVWCRCKRE